ncbi:hypothetical protein PGIGA_G00084720 [Pangasianodon gigas]|uniref:Uncharacterized protein n=1 Tax=Pangasianodon gigas TaxID=30993 RepID=A0ACC5XCS0_PANGG|nr:hypothetical protein [Pangasianodon gigas]
MPVAMPGAVLLIIAALLGSAGSEKPEDSKTEFGFSPLVPVKGLNNFHTIYTLVCFQLCGNSLEKAPFLFQHDNAPMHKASSVKTWFAKVGVEELHWPAQSPDLNPI